MKMNYKNRWWKLGAVLVLLSGFACGGGEYKPDRPPPASDVSGDYDETGQASWYGHPFHGRTAACGSRYDMDEMTVAHKTLACGTWVELTNLNNGKRCIALVTDRGPFVAGRIIDGSRAVARALDYESAGVVPIGMRILSGPEGGNASAQVKDKAMVGRFGVQVGAFQDKDNAKRYRKKMADEYGTASMTHYRDFWRVRVGDEASEKAAEKLKKRLKKDGINGYITRLD